jgi:hypothetical protein
MKEEKVGKKPKGMVVVISVGKPGGKKPEREADPDTKKKASIEELQQEAESLRGARDFPTARRFQSTANMLGQETPGREVAVQAAQALSPGDEQMPTALYDEGLQSPDFMDMRQNPEEYDPVYRENFMRLMRQMEKHRRQVARGQESLAELRRDDPSKFFSDRMTGRVKTSEDDDALSDILKGDLSNVNFCDCCSPSELAWAVMKAKKKSKPFHGYNPKRHHRKGGLSAKGRAKFKRETGANLKPPVTTKPSKLKPGSKKAKRRKSFCARMSGTKGPTSKKGKLTPKGAALKRWNC